MIARAKERMRDEIAIKAMQGLISDSSIPFNSIARKAYEIADYMMEEREKKKDGSS